MDYDNSPANMRPLLVYDLMTVGVPPLPDIARAISGHIYLFDELPQGNSISRQQPPALDPGVGRFDSQTNRKRP